MPQIRHLTNARAAVMREMGCAASTEHQYVLASLYVRLQSAAQLYR